MLRTDQRCKKQQISLCYFPRWCTDRNRNSEHCSSKLQDSDHSTVLIVECYWHSIRTLILHHQSRQHCRLSICTESETSRFVYTNWIFHSIPFNTSIVWCKYWTHIKYHCYIVNETFSLTNVMKYLLKSILQNVTLMWRNLDLIITHYMCWTPLGPS